MDNGQEFVAPSKRKFLSLDNHPKNPLWKKGLIYFLAWSMFGTGVPLMAGTKKETKPIPGNGTSISNPLINPILWNLEDLTKNYSSPAEMSDHYFKKGVDYATGEQTEQSYNNFLLSIKALGKNNSRAYTRDLDSLDAKAQEIYQKALQTARMAEVMQDMKEDQEKKNNGWVKWVLILLGGAAAAYGISKALKKKPKPEPEPQDYSTTVTIRAINHTKRVIGTYTIPNVMTSSTLDISINDIIQNLGVPANEVNPDFIVARGPVEDCIRLAQDDDGDISFTVSRDHNSWSFVYNIFLLNAENGANYGLVRFERAEGGGELRFGSLVGYQRAADEIPGPEADLNTAIAQLNAAAELPGFMRYGLIKQTGNNESGDFQVYYYDDPNPNHLGGHGYDGTNYFSRIDPEACIKYNESILGVWLEEIFELLGRATKFGGQLDTRHTITDRSGTGNLTEAGKDYWAAFHVLSSKKIGVTTATNQAAAQLASVGFDEDLGPVSVGADMAGNVRVGYNGKNFGVRTAVKAGKEGLSHSTTGTVNLPKSRINFTFINSPHQQLYSAAGETTLGRMRVGGSAAYSPENNSFDKGVRVGFFPKNSGLPDVQIRYNTHSDNTNKSQTVTLRGNFDFDENSNLMFTGTYNAAQGMQESSQLSLNAMTSLDIGLIERIMAIASYNKMFIGPFKQESFDFGLAKKLGPGVLSTGIDIVNGKVFPRFMYTISK